MSELSKTFNEFGNEILLRVNTLAPGRVIKFNKSTKRADIQPLFYMCDKEGTLYKQSLIEHAPVLDHCREIEAGDLIFYIPAQRSLENLNGSNFIDPDSYSLMSSNDAVVVGRFSP